jgi:hypothetical protein
LFKVGVGDVLGLILRQRLRPIDDEQATDFRIEATPNQVVQERGEKVSNCRIGSGHRPDE